MTHYIDKSALVAEINRVLDSYDPNEITSGRYALVDLRNFINTLEVKEVDLEKEVNQYCEKTWPYEEVDEDIIAFARHFYELGLKAQKVE